MQRRWTAAGVYLPEGRHYLTDPLLNFFIPAVIPGLFDHLSGLFEMFLCFTGFPLGQAKPSRFQWFTKAVFLKF
jgi:hypothetical protein